MQNPPDPKALPIERREDHAQWRAKVDQRLDDGSATMRKLSAELKANTETTNQVQADLKANTESINRVQANTSEVVDLLRSFQGAFRVLNMIGKFAKPLGYIVMACSACLAFWASLKGGGVHK